MARDPVHLIFDQALNRRECFEVGAGSRQDRERKAVGVHPFVGTSAHVQPIHLLTCIGHLSSLHLGTAQIHP